MTAPSGARLPRRTVMPAFGLNGFGKVVNHVAIPAGRLGDILPDRFSVHGQRFAMQNAGLAQFAQDRGQSSGVEEIFHQIFAGGLKIHQAGQAGPSRSKSSRQSGTPMRPAMAIR